MLTLNSSYFFLYETEYRTQQNIRQGDVVQN